MSAPGSFGMCLGLTIDGVCRTVDLDGYRSVDGDPPGGRCLHFLRATGPALWDTLAAATGRVGYPGWVLLPGRRAIDYGTWLDRLDDGDAQALARVIGQRLLLRWDRTAVVLWPQGIDGPAVRYEPAPGRCAAAAMVVPA